MVGYLNFKEKCGVRAFPYISMRNLDWFMCPICSLMHSISKIHTPQILLRLYVYSDKEFDKIRPWAIINRN